MDGKFQPLSRRLTKRHAQWKSTGSVFISPCILKSTCHRIMGTDIYKFGNVFQLGQSPITQLAALAGPMLLLLHGRLLTNYDDDSLVDGRWFLFLNYPLSLGSTCTYYTQILKKKHGIFTLCVTIVNIDINHY